MITNSSQKIHDCLAGAGVFILQAQGRMAMGALLQAARDLVVNIDYEEPGISKVLADKRRENFNNYRSALEWALEFSKPASGPPEIVKRGMCYLKKYYRQKSRKTTDLDAQNSGMTLAECVDIINEYYQRCLNYDIEFTPEAMSQVLLNDPEKLTRILLTETAPEFACLNDIRAKEFELYYG